MQVVIGLMVSCLLFFATDNGHRHLTLMYHDLTFVHHDLTYGGVK